MFGTLGTHPWSADGRTLLFSRMDDTGRMAIWSVEIESGRETQLTSPGDGTLDYSASYTFTGDRIVFGRNVAPTAALFVMPASGGEPREVLRENTGYLLPAWAPDGRRIVYSTASGGLWVVDADSGGRRQLSAAETDQTPVVARDGRILFDRFSHQTDLYVQDLAGKEEQRLTYHSLDNFDPTIVADGNLIAYTSTRTGNPEIWVLNRTNGTERQLTHRDAQDVGPQWSPDGRQIAFGSNHGGAMRLWVMNADGGAPRPLGDNELAGLSIGWAPDGSAIGVVGRTASGPALFLVNPKDGSRRKVLDGVGSFGWYPDSKHVVYASGGSGPGSEMRVANVESGKSSVLLQTSFAELAVAPDGSGVSCCTALSHSNMNLHVLPLAPPAAPGDLPRAAGAPRAVTHGEGRWHVHNGGWGPDSRQVIYTRDTDSSDIYLLEGAL